MDWPAINSQRKRNLSLFISRLEAEIEDVFFVEVGAMDGVMFDDLFEHVTRGRWRGLLVEPLPDMAAQLRENYRALEGRVRIANVALGAHEATRTLYRVDPEVARARGHLEYIGMSSFFRDRNGLAALFDEPGLVERVPVSCTTLPRLLEDHAVEKIDLLQLDTEGSDFEILGQLDFDRFRPALINMEICCLPPAELSAATALLTGQGYHLFRNGPADWLASSFEPPTGAQPFLSAPTRS